MDSLFTALSDGLAASPALAALAAFGWGLVSVALSPCHLMSVPLAIGYLGADPATRRSPAALSLVFALAGLVALTLIFAVTVTAGRIAGDLWGIGPWLGAALLLFAGLTLLDVLHLPGAGGSTLSGRVPRNLRGAALLGLIVGVTLGPCTFAFMAPVLGVALNAPLALATVVVVAFALGHTFAIGVAGLLGVRVAGWLTSGRRFTAAAKSVTGALCLVTAVYLVATAP